MSQLKVNAIRHTGASSDAITLAADGKATYAATSGTSNFTISDGNLVIGTAGHGIDFSSQTGTSATGSTTGDETFDHYEEGTWTPRLVYYNAGSGGWNNACTFSDDPETTNAGTYTRIGRVVYFSYYSSLFNVTDGVGYSAGIDGLPFANGGKYHIFSSGHTTAFQTSSVNGYVNINDDMIVFTKIDSTNGATWHTNNSYLMVSGFYFVS